MVKNPSGLRIGVQEITRIGMKEDDMDIIASFFERVLIKKEDTSKVKKDVIEFRKQFTEIKYTFTLSEKQYNKLVI